MSLPIPNLDNRRFQDIVDEAKRLIPHYCPEWTDHNVSDPGVAMIELFAWMTELLLYRVNQVPEKNYIKFLELIGVKLEPPRSARAPVTFYLSAPLLVDCTLPKETEVATVRTETNPAIIFTTEADLTIRPPTVLGAYTRSARRDHDNEWVTHELRRLSLPNQSIKLFPNPPVPGDAFYLALEKDHSHHVMALVMGCENAGGAGIDPSNPPLEWQVWCGGLTRWSPCEVEYDGTKGFNVDGEIILHLPPMSPGEFQNTRAYWLRCQLTKAQASKRHYDISPEIERLFRVESRGGSVGARHAITVLDETLGESDGTAGQTFKLLNSLILARDQTTDYLIVETPDGESERWEEVADFADSSIGDRHFTLDELDGTLRLGPALLQPDGSVYRFGSIPAKGSVLHFSRYQYGGGVAGNVSKGALSVLKSSIPYVAQVNNRQATVGGRDSQSLEDAKLRAARSLRTRTRAVTAEDFEYLASQVPGIARARCLAPGAQPGDPVDPKPGQLFVIVLPDVKVPSDQATPEQLLLSAELRRTVLDDLNKCCVLGVGVEVRPPTYIWVSVQAKLRGPEQSDLARTTKIRELAEEALYRYLNPFTGGPQSDGWPFGRNLHLSEIYAVLQSIPSVEFVDEVRVVIRDPGNPAASKPAPPRLEVPGHGLLCSAQHTVTVA